MKKYHLIIALLLGAFVFTSASISEEPNSLKDQLIGKWNWITVINKATSEESGIELITMGLATEVNTEFKADNTYIESKLRKGKTEYSTIKGEWKIENTDILATKYKDKWQKSKILKLSNDTIILEMNSQMNLLLIKQK